MGKKDLKQASQQRKSDLSLSITEQTWPSNGGGGVIWSLGNSCRVGPGRDKLV